MVATYDITVVTDIIIAVTDVSIFFSSLCPGSIEAFDYVKAPAFPHIYGGIPKKAVLATHRIIRWVTGSAVQGPGSRVRENPLVCLFVCLSVCL